VISASGLAWIIIISSLRFSGARAPPGPPGPPLKPPIDIPASLCCELSSSLGVDPSLKRNLNVNLVGARLHSACRTENFAVLAEKWRWTFENYCEIYALPAPPESILFKLSASVPLLALGIYSREGYGNLRCCLRVHGEMDHMC